MFVSSLHIYPIKSCRGLDLSELSLGPAGPELDRRYMLVDSENKFVTQRTHASLARIVPRVVAEALHIDAPDMPTLSVPLDGLRAPTRERDLREVQVWRDRTLAEDMGDEAAAWFSRCVGQELRLVRFSEHSTRWADKAYAGEGHRVAFPDGFPILLTTQASLDDLNARLTARQAQPISMSRFRPNLVVSGAKAFAEDGFQRLRVGEAILRVVKPCARCVVTTIDQTRGEKQGNEPLQSLSTYRLQDQQIMFGQNCVIEHNATLRVGDPVERLA